MKKAVFIFMFVLGFAWNCHAETWTFVQEGLSSYCIAGHSSCSFGGGTIAPTTAGTVRVVWVKTGSNVSITSVSGGGGTWNLCPASSCHNYDGVEGIDMAYSLGGSGGQTNITVNLSGGSGNQLYIWLYEFLPPPGTTASFDAAGTASGSCSGSCTATAVSVPVTATDVILQVRGGAGPVLWDSWSAPYIQTMFNNAISLNDSTGAAPTLQAAGSHPPIFSAIAFKSTAGFFTPPAQKMKAVNYVNNNGINCSPSCSLSIPSTGSGNLLYLEAADLNDDYLSSVSGAGTWVIPTGSNTCRNAIPGGHALSCAYILSTSPGATSLNITMTGNGSTAFAAMEISPLGGTFIFDTQGSTQNAPSLNPSGQPLNLSGTDDVVFQTIAIPGGTTAVTYYPFPRSAPGQAQMFFNNEAAFAALTDATTGVVPVWADQQNNTTLVTGVAFKTTSGTATRPAPPTNVTAVAN